MPFKSKAQMRKMAELERHGKVKAGTTAAWAAETPNTSKLPDRTTPNRRPKSIAEIKEIRVKKYGK